MLYPAELLGPRPLGLPLEEPSDAYQSGAYRLGPSVAALMWNNPASVHRRTRAGSLPQRGATWAGREPNNPSARA